MQKNFQRDVIARLSVNATLIALMAGLSSAALAQQTPPSVLPQIEKLSPQPPRPATNPAELPDRPAPRARELGKPTDELKVDVTGYFVDQGPPELAAALARITAPYVGKDRSYEDLVNAAQAVTAFLQRDMGYYIAYAYLPEQKAVNGRFRIAVLEGRLDQVMLNWTDGLPVDRSVVEAYLAHLTPGAILTVKDIERVVFLVNDLRGLSATFELREGKEWGTASVVVTPRADEHWSKRVDFDVDGSRFSGVARLGAQAILNSPGGRGDGLTISGLTSLTGGLQFALLGYTTPLGSNGLKVGASLSAFRYEFDKDIIPLDLSGSATAATLYALYPVVRARNLNLFTLVSAEHKQFADKEGISGFEAKKHSDELRLGITGDFRDDALSGGVNTYDLNGTVGRVTYDSNAPAATDDDRNFRKVGLGFSRLQNLVTGSLLLYVNYRGQLAFNNLDSTQQFRLGGADGVRAFAPGEGNGDSGHLITTELRFLPPVSFFGPVSRELVFAVFYDWGRVTLRDDPSQRGAAFNNHATLAGRGVSIAWERPRSFNFRIHIAEPSVGHPTGDPVVRRPRIYAEFSKQL